MINQFLHWTEANGLNTPLYNVFFVGGGVALMLVYFFNAKNYQVPLKKAAPFVLFVYPLAVAWMFFLFWAESGFRNFGGNNIVRVFVWVPLIAWPFCKLFKLNFATMCDCLAPIVCVQHGVSHFGCIFGSCCYSYSWEQGIYNHVLDCNTFPIQPIEALVAVAIVLTVLFLEKREGYKSSGKHYPLMLILFGYSRFLLEFARDNNKLFWGISNLAIHALFMGIVGTVWYCYLRKRDSK